jgi:hypothetical protein
MQTLDEMAKQLRTCLRLIYDLRQISSAYVFQGRGDFEVKFAARNPLPTTYRLQKDPLHSPTTNNSSPKFIKRRRGEPKNYDVQQVN